jgi:hypothetical protein
MEDTDQFRLAKAFLSQLRKPNPQQLPTLVTDDVLWTFPGKASISGEAVGVEGVMARAKVIAAHPVEVEIVRAVYSFSGLAVLLHHTEPAHDRKYETNEHTLRRDDARAASGSMTPGKLWAGPQIQTIRPISPFSGRMAS